MVIESKLAYELKIGQILVRLGFLDTDQLEQALEVQKKQKTYKPLGEICRELGFIPGHILREIISKYNKRLRIGELLLKMGVISGIQLKVALEEQKQTREKLAEILIRKGYLTPSALVDSLCMQLGIDKVHPRKENVDRELFNKVNFSYYVRKRVVPLRLDKNKRILTVVLEDPTDNEVAADMRKMFNVEVEPVVCSPGEIGMLLNEILDVWYNYNER